MRTFQLEREQTVPLDQETTFAFFADALNLQRLTPPWLHFEVLTGAPLPMHEGALIYYKLRLHGLPIRWLSEITQWQPPHRFMDVQRRGPYLLWEHTHSFEPTAGGTLVRDTVRYAVPGGSLVDRYFVSPDLKRIFDYRAEVLSAWSSSVMAASWRT